MKTRRPSRGAQPAIVWPNVREQYVTGSESLAEIAKRLGVSLQTVEAQASSSENDGTPWGKQRAALRDSVAREFRREEAQRQIDRSLARSSRHAEMAEQLIEAAFPMALESIISREFKGSEKLKAWESMLMAERHANGLDRITAAVEITGKDGGAIEHEFEPVVDDELRDLAQAAMEALFGDHAEPQE